MTITRRQQLNKILLTRLHPQLIPMYQAVSEVIRVRHDGMKKHGETWRQVPFKEHLDHVMEHLQKYFDGEMIEEESGLHHLAHIICRLLFVLQLEIEANQ